MCNYSYNARETHLFHEDDVFFREEENPCKESSDSVGEMVFSS